jgi:hypothetical protein
MKFKSKKVEERLVNCTHTIQKLAKEMYEWSLNTYGVEITITETWTTAYEDHKLNRVSDTHRTGRAIDIRTKDIPDWFKPKFIEYFNSLYQKSLGAQTKEGPVLIVDKKHGSGPHWHIQVRRGVK